MKNIAERVGAGWRFPMWEEDGSGVWFLMQAGVLVGEVYEIDNGIKWHCKTSDWRDTNATSIEQAKAQCLASFWKEEWTQLRNLVNAALREGKQ